MTSASEELRLLATSPWPGVGRRHSEEGTVEDSVAGGRGPLLAPLMARVIVAVVFIDFCAVAFLFVRQSGADADESALAAGYLLALLALQLFYFGRRGVNLRSPLTWGMLLAQSALVYLPMLQFGQAWLGPPSLLAGTVLLILPPVAAWTVFTAIVGGVAGLRWSQSHQWLDTMYVFGAVTTVALYAYGLTRLAGVITELHAARAELANTAVAHERLRFARDLHDLLGLSLSAIAPKGELARRLMPRNPDRAKQELSEILEISRRALTDVRSVAHGYRDLNLDEESRTAESVLAASRVEVRMERNHGELPVHIRTMLASVLREGVANVLEHSDAERCDILMRQAGNRVSLEIVNDGVTDADQAHGGYNGSGLATLRERVARLGGELAAGLERDGRFHLRMSIPVSPGRAEESDAQPGQHHPRTAAQLARALVAATFTGMALISGLQLAAYKTGDPVTISVSVGYLILLLILQLFYFSRPTTQLRSPASYALLVAQAALVYLPVLEFGVPWLALAGFLAGSALLVLPQGWGWAAFVAVLATSGWVQATSDPALVEIVFAVGGHLINGLAVYGLTWMVRSVTELRAARIQLAQGAVADERLRFARDLHDLLGLSLSAITLKTELAHRLVTAAPEKAREELTEILGIARLALADVRLVASGYRDLSLDEEFRTAESLLVAADVDVRLSIRIGELPEQVGTLLATVLREGVTNVLRHSKGERCEITVLHNDHAVSMDIVNDGVPEKPIGAPQGSGIHNLSYRVALLGGELTAGLEPDGRFRLRAKVPA